MASKLAAVVATLTLLGAACSADTAPAETLSPTTTAPDTTAPTTSVDVPTVAPTSAAPTTTTRPPVMSSTTVPPPTTGVVAPGVVRTTIEITGDGRVRTYVLSVPATVDPGVPAPLVVDLHGLSATPDSQEELSAMAVKAAAEGFVVAQPAGLGLLPSWSAGDNSVSAEDVAFLEAVVADVATRTAIDADRVFASGFSNGGGMANRLACNAAETFAAIASVSGSYIEYLECDPVRAVPVIAFHGTADFVVNYDGFAFLPDVNEWAELWALRNGCGRDPADSRVTEDVTKREFLGCSDGGDVVLYTIEGGAHGWPGTTSSVRLLNSTQSIDATDLVWAFFDEHARPLS